jgi:plastocyanin
MKTKPALMALGALTAALAAAPPVRAGSIQGRVPLHKASDAERTVVYIETVPEGSFTAETAMMHLSQKGARFNPGVLPVLRGSQVDMTNDDWVSHNVFSKSATKTFDLSIYSQDTRRVVTFDTLGAVQLFCSIHPRMSAVVLVLQNPFFTKPGPDGTFALDNVPPGTYKLKAYRPGDEAGSVDVRVPSSGSVTARF